MAGIVFLLDDQHWSHNSWVFYWLVDTMADHSSNAELAAHLRCISDNHLGCVDLADLDDAQLGEFRTLAREAPRFARTELAASPHRDALVDQIIEFADLVAADRGRS